MAGVVGERRSGKCLRERCFFFLSSKIVGNNGQEIAV